MSLTERKLSRLNPIVEGGGILRQVLAVGQELKIRKTVELCQEGLNPGVVVATRAQCPNSELRLREDMVFVKDGVPPVATWIEQ